MEYVSDGDTLYAQVLEGRSPVVFLHPTPLHHGFWLPVANALPGYRRILPDLRGHGESPLGAAPRRVDEEEPVLTIAQLARDTVALLDELGVERAVLVGCSIGGYTLYELWRTVPERIAGLVFCSSKPQADTDAERAKRGEWITKMEPACLAGELRPPREFVEAMLTALLAGATRVEQPELVAEVRGMIEQVRPEAVQAIQRGLGSRPDARMTAVTVTVPSGVIAGVEDTSSTPADLLALQALLAKSGSHAGYYLLEQAGHYGPREQPGKTAAILREFLERL
jgi:pimeloyl-ACP methyl ester carboxylesterase